MQAWKKVYTNKNKQINQIFCKFSLFFIVDNLKNKKLSIKDLSKVAIDD